MLHMSCNTYHRVKHMDYIATHFTPHGTCKSRYENPQKLTQLGPRSHPRTLVGKRTAQKDLIKDITGDSQVNSNFPCRWSPDSLTFNIYFYLFSYSYITRITVIHNTQHLNSPQNKIRRAALGRATIKLLAGGGGGGGGVN